MLKGTRTAMSFVAEARRLARQHAFPHRGQPDYSAMADVLSRAVLFANWDVVGAAALVRAGSVTRIVEVGLKPDFRSDELVRRLTWRLLADASHELTDTPVIEDAFCEELDITEFVARRWANRAEDQAAAPTPIGRIQIQLAPNTGLGQARDGERVPRAPKGVAL